MMIKKFLILFFLLTIPLISAQVEIGKTSTNTFGVVIEIPEPPPIAAGANVTLIGNISGIWLNDSTRTYLNSSHPQDVNFTGNLSMGSNLIFRLGETIDNLINGWLRVNGNLMVDGDLNISNNLFWDSTNKRLSFLNEENTIDINGATFGETVAIHGLSDTEIQLGLHRHSNTAAVGAALDGQRSRGAEGAETIVQDGDNLFDFVALGHDGTDYIISSRIDMEVDGTPGNNDMPGRIVFKTTSDGGVGATERMRISNDGSINMSNNVTIQGKKLTLANIKLTNESINGLWNGSLNIETGASSENNLLFLIQHQADGTQHLWLQEGGPGQASGITRSFMIVNEVTDILNTTNITDCSVWQDNLSIPSNFQVDCNTTTTGADLIVGDDFVVGGDIFVTDEQEEYHSLNRIIQRLDEMFNNVFFNQVNQSIVGTDLIINDSGIPDNLAVLLNGTATDLGVREDAITLNTGSTIAPTVNFISYQNQDNPVLTITTSEPSVDHADVSILYLGADTSEIYLFDDSTSHGEQFVDHVYDRFADQGALYIDGLTQTVGTDNINISSGGVKIRISKLDYKTDLDSFNDFFYINSTGHFVVCSDFTCLLQYSDGGIISANKYYNIVWGVVPISSVESRLLAIPQNEPGAEHTKAIDAEEDAQAILFFPSNSDFKKAFVPIARTIHKRTGNNDLVIFPTNGELFQDLRGEVTSGGGGSPTPPITNHENLNSLEFNDSGHTFSNSGQVLDIGNYNLTTTGNVTLGERLIFALGNFISNSISGWLIINGNLTTTGGLIVQGNVIGNGTANFTLQELNATGGGAPGAAVSANWLNTSTEMFLNSSFPQNVNLTQNLSIGGLTIEFNGSDTIIWY